jgi:KaiC/GvpD/RAD55 family RecA-like ATPase
MTDGISLNLFDGVHGTQPLPTALSLEELAEFLAPQHPPFVTREERKARQLFSMNIYKEDTTRGKDNVEFMTGVVFDFDNKNDYVSIGTVLNHVKDKRIAYAWYTTHSHTESRPKWRLVIPFASPLPVSEWLPVYQQCVVMIGNPPGIDHAACKDVAHMWFPPYRNGDQPYSADSDLEASFIEPLDIQLYLTPEEQAHYQTLMQERSQITEMLSFPEQAVSKPKSEFSLKQAMHVVSYLDADCDYPLWIKVGMALHHQFNGSETAFKIWDAWSAQSPSEYKDGKDLITYWHHFKDREKSVGIGTLIHLAKKEGYDPAREQEPSSFHLMAPDVIDFIALDIPIPDMLIDPIIPEQGLVMLYAPRGIGKTYLSLSLAYIAAAGKQMLDGKWKACQENKVVFVDGEMPAGRLQYRIKGIIRSIGSLSKRGLLKIITPDLQEIGIPDLSTVAGQKLIEEHLEDAKLLVLDNLSSLFRTGSENEAESWNGAQEWFLSLRRRAISVLLIHHANKNGSQRGTSKKEDLLDTVISLRRPEDYSPEEGARFEVHYEKARNFYGEAAEPFEVQLKEQDDRYFWVVKEIEDDDETKKIIELYQSGRSQRDIAAKLKMSLGLVNKKIQKAEGKI